MCNSHAFDDTNEEYLSDSDESLRDGYKPCAARYPSVVCEKYHNSKFKLCQKCRDYYREANSRRMKRKKAEGLCWRGCEMPIDWSRSKSMCARCLDRKMELRESLISQGLCGKGCGPIDWSRSESQCAKCLDRKLEGMELLVAQGLCRKGCGPIDWSRSKSQCAKCLDRTLELRESLISQGLCEFGCGRKRVNARQCDICSKYTRDRVSKYYSTEKGKKLRIRDENARADIDDCLEKANRNEQGVPLGTWTGVPLTFDNQNDFDYRSADHADSDLKYRFVRYDANPSNWDDCDGPHNWTLEGKSFNSHKSKSCIYELYEKNDPRFPMRPLEDILKDLIRQRVRIPPPKDESVLSASTVELVNQYRDIQVASWLDFSV